MINIILFAARCVKSCFCAKIGKAARDGADCWEAEAGTARKKKKAKFPEVRNKGTVILYGLVV